MATDGTFAYIINGTTTTPNLLRYDPVANTYMVMAPPTTGTFASAAAFLNGKIYRIAGDATGTGTGQTNTVEAYTIATNTWAPVANFPAAVSFLAAVPGTGVLYAAGGITSAATDSLTTAVYDPIANTWNDAAIADLPATPAPHWGAASGVLNGKWVLGPGASGGAIQSTAIQWDPNTNLWTNVPNAPLARYRNPGAVLNGSFYTIGGNPFAGTNTVQKTDLPWHDPNTNPQGEHPHPRQPQGTPTPTPTPGTPTPTPGGTCPPVITHSTSQTITPGSVSCNGGAPGFFHADNSYWRAFNMGTFTGGAAYNVTSVSFGIETATANPAVGNQPVTVRLHTQTTGTFPGGTRTQIATTTVNVVNQMATVLNVPLVVTVPAGTTELIMEVFTPNGQAPANNSFFIGSNAAAQTGPSYISATACGLTTPTDVSTIGFPNMHIVLNVNGVCGPTPTPGTPTPPTPGTPTPTPGTPTPTPACTPAAEGFDDITTLPGAGWVQTNHSTTIGTTGWFQGNSAVFPAQGGATTSYIGANFNNDGGPATDTISNWLLTPPLTLQNGAVLTFFTRTVDVPAFPDRLQVRMSTSGASSNVGTTATDVGDFTTLLLDINPTYTLTGYPNVWTQFTVTLSGIASPTTGRLAFRYFVENGGPSRSELRLHWYRYVRIQWRLRANANPGNGTPTPTPSDLRTRLVGRCRFPSCCRCPRRGHLLPSERTLLLHGRAHR